MADQFKFNPQLEMLRSLGSNAMDFVAHPGQQSTAAMQAAQNAFLQWANSGREGSPLDPMLRPGVIQANPDLGGPAMANALDKYGQPAQ